MAMSEKSQKYLKTSLYVVVLVLAAVGLFLMTKNKGAEKQMAMGGMPPVVVTAKTIKAKDTPLHLEYVGQVSLSQDVEVRAQVSGILLRRYYTEGSSVRKGQSLFLIDPQPYRAALDKALGNLAQDRARLLQAKIDYERQSALYAQQAVSAQIRDNAEATYKAYQAAVAADEAMVRSAQIDLNYTNVVAPASGIVGKAILAEGNLVNNGTLLTEIVQVNPLYVDFSIPIDEQRQNDQLIAQGKMGIQPGGTSVHLTFGDGSTFPHPGKIDFSDRKVDPNMGTVQYRAKFPNPEGKALPGQFSRVGIDGFYLKQALLVPQRAVLHTEQGTLLNVLDAKNIAHVRKVTLAQTVGNEVVVAEGLVSGERIVVDGADKVRPNSKVVVAKTLPSD